MRTLGCSEEKVILPGSSALVTVMTTSRVAVSFFLSVATTVTIYMLSMLASMGFSKLGDFLKARVAVTVTTCGEVCACCSRGDLEGVLVSTL